MPTQASSPRPRKERTRQLRRALELTLTYDGGAHAQLTTSIGADCPSVVTISGTDGWLRTSAPLFNPGELIIQPRQGTLRTEQFDVLGHGFSYELREVMRCLQAGFTESAVMPLGDTVRVMDLLGDGQAYPTGPA